MCLFCELGVCGLFGFWFGFVLFRCLGCFVCWLVVCGDDGLVGFDLCCGSCFGVWILVLCGLMLCVWCFCWLLLALSVMLVTCFVCAYSFLWVVAVPVWISSFACDVCVDLYSFALGWIVLDLRFVCVSSILWVLVVSAVLLFWFCELLYLVI